MHIHYSNAQHCSQLCNAVRRQRAAPARPLSHRMSTCSVKHRKYINLEATRVVNENTGQ